jgi:hypothetical protein
MDTGFSVGIMQPYFFPYWGHCALIAATDRWIVFDVTQYTPKTWMNRNRVLHPSQGWQYVSVPLDKASMSIKTFEARLLDADAAGAQIVRQLMHYRKRAPHHARVVDLIRGVFADRPDDRLVSLNALALARTCEYLGIPFRHQICSELALDLPSDLGPGDWAPEIASRLGAARYVNPIGGRDLFDLRRFAELGLELSFLECGSFEYRTPGYQFEPNLSIIDAMMWNEPETIRRAIVEARAQIPASI